MTLDNSVESTQKKDEGQNLTDLIGRLFQDLKEELKGELKGEFQKFKRDLKTEFQTKIELINDRITMIDTTITKYNLPDIPRRPNPIYIGPPGHGLSETRSRWKRGWFHSL